MTAEWDNPTRILLTLPGKETDWDYILEEATDQYAALLKALSEGRESVVLIADGELPEKIARIVEGMNATVVKDIPFNDTWTRDYGPITVEEDGKRLELDFRFDGWGGKFAADRDNSVTRRLADSGILEGERYRDCLDYTLEGGSVESDGKGTILTTTRCLCSQNRNGGKTKEEVEKILAERLGAQRVIWLDYGYLAGDDTDSHIDTLARLAPDDTILYVAPPLDYNDEHYREMILMQNQLKGLSTQSGKPYRLVALPFPDPVYDEEGHRLPATYANYLVTAENVYIPTYNQPENDAKAVAQIKKAFPHHRPITVNCETLIKQHGSLHCSTMQLY